jgi:putative transcriptional regulator
MARGSTAVGRAAGGGRTDGRAVDGQGSAGDRGSGQEPGEPAISIRLDELLAERAMTLTELSERVGITVVNLSVLKNGRARAIRFSTLAGLCSALGCQPGDLLRYEPGTRSPST